MDYRGTISVMQCVTSNGCYWHCLLFFFHNTTWKIKEWYRTNIVWFSIVIFKEILVFSTVNWEKREKMVQWTRRCLSTSIFLGASIIIKGNCKLTEGSETDQLLCLCMNKLELSTSVKDKHCHVHILSFLSVDFTQHLRAFRVDSLWRNTDVPHLV